MSFIVYTPRWIFFQLCSSGVYPSQAAEGGEHWKMFPSLDEKLTSQNGCAISEAHPARMIDQKGRNTEMFPGAVLAFLGDAFSHQEERK